MLKPKESFELPGQELPQDAGRAMLIFHEGSKGILSTVNKLHASPEWPRLLHLFFMPFREAVYYTEVTRKVVRERKKKYSVLSHVAIAPVPSPIWNNKENHERFMRCRVDNYKLYESAYDARVDFAFAKKEQQ